MSSIDSFYTTCIAEPHNMHQWLPLLLTIHVPHIDWLCLFLYFNMSPITGFDIEFSVQVEVYIQMH